MKLRVISKVAALGIILTAGQVHVSNAQVIATTPQEKRNIRVVNDYFRLMFEVHDVDRAAALLADDYVTYHPPQQKKADAMAGFKTRWPTPGIDTGVLKKVPALIVAKDDYVAVMLKNPRPLPSDPTKTYDTFGFDVYRLNKEGKIVEHWDGATLNPMPEPATPAKP